MAESTVFVCSKCGKQSRFKMSLCTSCNEVNSYVPKETVPSEKKTKHVTTRKPVGMAVGNKPCIITNISSTSFDRYSTGIGEFDRVLGGGIVPGSLTLIGGDPGLGKSTLLLSTASSMSKAGLTVLYVSGEESESQIKMRADRMELEFGKLFLVFETDIDRIIREFIPDIKPDILIIDSINTMSSADISSASSSPNQINYAVGQLQGLAKSTGLSVFIIGQVVKSGDIAGTKKLVHAVDTVLYLEGDKHNMFRLLRAQKNRFGAAGEIGVFEMVATGLIEVANPSAAFLSERAANKPGSSVAVLMEGSRPIIVEIQSLCSTSSGNPARRSTGLNRDRMHIIAAVLDKYIPVVDLFDTDLFMSVVGGMKISEPAADLAMALAIVSSFHDIPTPNDLVAIGEIGLTGGLLSVMQLEMRLREAANLGFNRVIIPSLRKDINVPKGLTLIQCSSLEQAILAAFDGELTFETENVREESQNKEKSRRSRRRKGGVIFDKALDEDENGYYDTDKLFEEDDE